MPHEVTPQQIAAYYALPNKDPIILGGMIRSALLNYQTYQRIAKTAGMTAGVAHHYASLLDLPPSLQNAISERRLKYKAARAIADLADPERHALPFMDGTLSTVYVERYVALAKRTPGLTTERLVDMVTHPEKYLEIAKDPTFEAPEASVPKPERYHVVTPSHVRQTALNMRAILQQCRWNQTVDALMARSELERLQAEVARSLAESREPAL